MYKIIPLMNLIVILKIIWNIHDELKMIYFTGFGQNLQGFSENKLIFFIILHLVK